MAARVRDLPQLRGNPKLRVTTAEPLLALPESDTFRHALPEEGLRAWTGRHPPRSESSRLYAVALSPPRAIATCCYSSPASNGMHLIVRIQNRLKIQRDHWFLAIARGVAPEQQLAGKVAALHPPRGHFWADPMIVRSKGHTFMFFEDYDYSLRRAQISVVEIDASGRIGVPRTALQADHHLSYPFVFEWRGDHFMIPETASVRAVRLYRATEFPTRWEYVQDLLTDIEAVDTTLCEHEGRWYLFTACERGGRLDCGMSYFSSWPTRLWGPGRLTQ